MTSGDSLRIARAAAHAAYVEAGGPRAFTWCDAFGGTTRVRDVIEAHPLMDDAQIYDLLVTGEPSAADYARLPLPLRIGLATFRAAWLSLRQMQSRATVAVMGLDDARRIMTAHKAMQAYVNTRLVVAVDHGLVDVATLREELFAAQPPEPTGERAMPALTGGRPGREVQT